MELKIQPATVIRFPLMAFALLSVAAQAQRLEPIAEQLQNLKSATSVTIYEFPSNMTTRANLDERTLQVVGCKFQAPQAAVEKLITLFESAAPVSSPRPSSYEIRQGAYFSISSGRTISILLYGGFDNSQIIHGEINSQPVEFKKSIAQSFRQWTLENALSSRSCEKPPL